MVVMYSIGRGFHMRISSRQSILTTSLKLYILYFLSSVRISMMNGCFKWKNIIIPSSGSSINLVHILTLLPRNASII